MEVLYLVVATHLTIVSVTLYLHRSQAHKAIQFHPILSHCMRFWLWLTTGMNTKEWVAVHRKHHRFTDREGDPHSPILFGFFNILFKGVFYYIKESKHATTLINYGQGTPTDFIEEKLYSPYPWLGISLLLVLNIIFFGWWGLLIWGIQMLWIPFWAAGVVNGLGHWWGYKNKNTNDNSKNIFPWGLVIGGEELHSNHHLNPASPKLSLKWWEFDIGWFWLKLFMFLRLAKIK